MNDHGSVAIDPDDLCRVIHDLFVVVSGTSHDAMRWISSSESTRSHP